MSQVQSAFPFAGSSSSSWQEIFYKLLTAESEAEVQNVLASHRLLDERLWVPYDNNENNFAQASNQQAEPAAALTEKITNAIDAVLLRRAHEEDVDPESAAAPQSMREAVERFFGIKTGQLRYVDARQRTKLAENIQLMATGSKRRPNYLIVDRGEGQTPRRFPDTFLSIGKSNKLRIPFVQGKFNSGGLGVLQFCGEENFQLICSRRHPSGLRPAAPSDDTHWGFTIVRRLEPSHGRRSSMYVYLAPNGIVPTFRAEGIDVLPGINGDGGLDPYRSRLDYGTVVKLYDYRWTKRTVITLDARRELQRFLVEPALPYQLAETRDGYSAHSLTSTLSGAMLAFEDDGQVDQRLEAGFPSYGSISIDGIGDLPYRIYAFTKAVESRDVPTGVVFLINGQSHGQMPARFLTSSVRLGYLTGDKGPLLVVVDCTEMTARAREDFFLASRDRVRVGGEIYENIRVQLREVLSSHRGLKELNQRRRQQELLESPDGQREVDRFQQLIDADPGLKRLFGFGDRLVTRSGPGERKPFEGKQFPTFFRLANEPKSGLIKLIPTNRFGYIQFETDATNDYFNRPDSPGEFNISRPDLVTRQHLWNGRLNLGMSVPSDAQVGDEFPVNVSIFDVTQGDPFESDFVLRAEAPADDREHKPGTPNQPRDPNGKKATAPSLALPNVVPIERAQWADHGFSEKRSINIVQNPDGALDFYINVDNAFLLTELQHAEDAYRGSIRDAFKFGLTFAALAHIRHQNEQSPEDDFDPDEIKASCDALARVVIPIVRTLCLSRDESA